MNSGPVPSPIVIRSRKTPWEVVRFGKAGHGGLHLQRRLAGAQLVTFAAKKDEQRIAAEFEQVAAIAIGHLKQSGKETIDDGRDLFRALFASWDSFSDMAVNPEMSENITVPWTNPPSTLPATGASNNGATT